MAHRVYIGFIAIASHVIQGSDSFLQQRGAYRFRIQMTDDSKGPDDPPLMPIQLPIPPPVLELGAEKHIHIWGCIGDEHCQQVG